MFGSIVDTIVSFLFSSMFNVHTYVGIFLGAIFAPVWMMIGNYLKALVIKSNPSAAPYIAEAQAIESAVVAAVTPVAVAVETNAAVKAAQPK